MAQLVEQKLKVNIPAEKVWAILQDFSSIERFAMTVKESPVLPGKTSGLGAKRKCEFYDGKSMVEEIIEYQEGERLRLLLTEHPMPLKSFFAEMKVEKINATSSEISMSMEFVAKGGPFGWVMGFFMMRPFMKGVIKNILTGLAYHAATGKKVENKMPSQSRLATAFNH